MKGMSVVDAVEEGISAVELDKSVDSVGIGGSKAIVSLK
jgi:hypothetical protein